MITSKPANDDHFKTGHGSRVVAEIVRSGGPTGPKENVYYLHDDVLGSIKSISDETGASVEAQTYAVFGASSAPRSSRTRLGYTAHEEDDLGLVNMGARLYDPQLGRFLQPDPWAAVGNSQAAKSVRLLRDGCSHGPEVFLEGHRGNTQERKGSQDPDDHAALGGAPRPPAFAR